MKRIVITGPTASGKGGLALALARHLGRAGSGAEIISVDSMKIFRDMDVGTAKPPAELRREIPFHLIDIVDPWEDFSVGTYLPMALDATREIESRGRVAIFQGGTALYLKALFDGFFEGPQADHELRSEIRAEIESRGLEALHGELAKLDPEVAEKIHPNDERRIVRALEVIRVTGRRMSEHWRVSGLRLDPGSYACFGIDWDRAELYRRIDERVLRMADDGLFEETARLAGGPRPLSRCASKCIGYRQILEGMERGESREGTVERIQRDTRRFAKQQMTWFRRFPITWLAPDEPRELAARVVARMERRE